jgi:hypothetical protein
MPSGDRRGPDGMGPMTGRGLGYCNRYNDPGYTKQVPRRGMGFGRGFGQGAGYGRGFSWRANNSYAPSVAYEPQDELQSLTNEAKQMKENLDAVNERIHELEKK